MILEEFFARLNDCDGAIVGSLPRLVLLSGTAFEQTSPSPRDLNIATMSGCSEAMHDFFENLGYESRTVAASPQHQNTAMHVERLTKEIEGEVSDLVRRLIHR